MKFFIADTFTDSLARLSADEQKAAKTTAFDLQANPKQPSLKFHKLDRAKDPRFWSVRGSLDLRLIVHKDGDDLVACYVGHHDDAYTWAERRRLEVHPTTGAAQIVAIRETVREIIVPKYVEEERPAKPVPKLFTRFSDNDLLAFGVPPEWLGDVRDATEVTILDLCDHLPAEAAEALLEIATGSVPISPEHAGAVGNLDGVPVGFAVGRQHRRVRADRGRERHGRRPGADEPAAAGRGGDAAGHGPTPAADGVVAQGATPGGCDRAAARSLGIKLQQKSYKLGSKV